MGVFSFLFKKKEKIKSNTINDHKDICDFLEVYKAFEDFINQDEFISRKEFEKFHKSIKDKVEYIKKLNESKLLSSLCVNTECSTILKYVSRIDNIEEEVESHNKQYLIEKKNQYKEYLDHILDDCDPNIVLDDDQRNCVLSDEDYSLIIAGAT